MNTALRLGIVLAAVALVTAPLAFSQTRDIHETYYETFVPEEANVAAQPVEGSFVNCGDDANPNAHIEKHNGREDLVGGDGDNYNSDLLCWENDEHSLWTDEDGIVAASAPFYECQSTGYELDISLQNAFPVHVPQAVQDDPDLTPEENGVIVASGSFYVIPEITGPDAGQVEAVWFSFLETTPTVNEAGIGGGSDEMCVQTESHAASAGGAYYEFYRGDTEFEDPENPGWIIPVNTLLVPDNMYGAKLTFLGHADETSDLPVDEGDIPQPYPGGLEVLGMGYVYAIVDNNADDTSWSPCEPTRQPCDNQDTTPPWPTIVPGDVSWEELDQTDRGTDTLDVIFGEHIQDLTVVVDGLGVVPSDFNDDALRDNADVPHHSSDVDSVALMQTQQDSWGEHFSYDAASDSDLDWSACSEISVTAVDLHGNSATKTVTAGECSE